LAQFSPLRGCGLSYYVLNRLISYTSVKELAKLSRAIATSPGERTPSDDAESDTTTRLRRMEEED